VLLAQFSSLSLPSFLPFFPFFIFLLFLLFSLSFFLRRHRRRFTLSLFVFSLVSLGFFSTQQRYVQIHHLEDVFAGKDSVKSVCTFSVMEAARKREKGDSYIAEVLACAEFEQTFKTQLFIFAEAGKYEPGDVLQGEASFKKPNAFQNPASFNYPLYLSTKDIGTLAFSKNETLKKIEVSEKSIFQKTYLALQKRIEKTASAQSAPIMKALLLGEKNDLQDDTKQIFSELGIAHVLAISGLHIGFIFLLLALLISLLLFPFRDFFLHIPRWKLVSPLALLCVWVFIVFVGMPISSVRAGIMLSCFVLGKFLLRKQDLLTTLSCSALIIVFIWPLSVFDLSFQLSFLSVGGIILFMPRALLLISSLFPDVQKKYYTWKLVQFIVLTCVASLVSLPLVAYAFHFVSILGIVSNLFVVPFFAFFLLPLLMAAFIFFPFARLSVFFLKFASFSLERVLHGASSFYEHTKSLVFHCAPSALSVVALYFVLLLFFFPVWKRKKNHFLFFTFLFCFIFYAPFFFHSFQRTLKVSVIDVGQGDSMLIELPGGKSVLIDAGGLTGSSFEIGQKVIAPLLWRKGISSLDLALLTHADYDHAFGFHSLLPLFSIKTFWWNGFEPNPQSEQWKRLKAELQLHHVPMLAVNENSACYEEKKISLCPLAPSDEHRFSTQNNASVVTELRYKDVAMLFTGDIEKRTEKKLIPKLEGKTFDVFKVAHHGSKTSSSQNFLDAFKGKIALLSVGKGNRYHLPNPLVMQRLQRKFSTVFGTDKDGLIELETDGRKIEVTTSRIKHGLRAVY